MIALKNINKYYYKNKSKIIALTNVNYEFINNRFYAIMGCSGSGKSTLLNIIGLLDMPSSGHIYLDDFEIKNTNQRQLDDVRLKKIGYVFQEYYLCDNLTVYENVMLPLLLNKNMKSDKKDLLVKKLVNLVGLNNRINHYPSELSGGERQRVALARALVNDPEIIIADEPTGNLDSNTEKIIFNIFKKLANYGKCVIVVSHSELIKKYADKILFMKNGNLRGELNEIKKFN